MTAPEGSVVNCKFPAAVAARMQVGHFMTEMVFKALSAATPDNIIAGSGGTPAQTNIFYGRRHNGKPWHTMIIRGGGMGAGSRMDGHHCAIFPANGANTPVEIFESDTPLIVESQELVCDSGGPGKMRGGIGRKMVIRVPEDAQAPPVSHHRRRSSRPFSVSPRGHFRGQPRVQGPVFKKRPAGGPGRTDLLRPRRRAFILQCRGRWLRFAPGKGSRGRRSRRHQWIHQYRPG